MTEKKQRLPLCSSPFLTAVEKPEGVSPCCSRLSPSFDTHKVGEEWWNGEYLKEMRKKMFSYNTLPDFCKECMRAGLVNSEAGYSNEYVRDLAYNETTGAVRSHPFSVHLFLGNKCNLACQTCNANYSSGYAKLHGTEAEKDLFTDPFKLVELYNPSNWTLYGGEPFMYPKLYDLLMRLMDTNGVVSILTNGTIDLSRNRCYNEIIKKFPKKFCIGYSVDAEPNFNKYVRQNTTDEMMQTIVDNIFLTANDKIYTNIHATISTINISQMYAFVDWGFKQRLWKHPGINFDVNVVKLPKEFSPIYSKLPDIDLVEAANDKLREVHNLYKSGILPNISKEIERLILKIEKVVSHQRKLFSSRIPVIDLTNQQ